MRRQVYAQGERLRVCRIGNMDSGDEEPVDVPHGRTNQERNVAVPNDYIALQRRQHGLIQSLQIPLTCKQNTGIHHFPLHIPCARMDNKPFHEFHSVWLTREKEIPAGTYPTDISVSKMQKRRISAGGICSNAPGNGNTKDHAKFL